MFTPYPFANLNFKVFGGHLIHSFELAEPPQKASEMAFDMGGQWVLHGVVQDALEQIVFESDADQFAARWYPFGRAAHIIIDPHYAAGRPIVEGSRVPILIIKERFDAGDSIRFLAKDYGLATSVVEEALRYAA
jgi:uncharacterized protein (DUF433 family)